MNSVATTITAIINLLRAMLSQHSMSNTIYSQFSMCSAMKIEAKERQQPLLLRYQLRNSEQIHPDQVHLSIQLHQLQPQAPQNPLQ